MTTLLAGAGRADISPEKGTYLAGYGHPFRTCKSVRDPLSVTVLLLDDGAERTAIVALDVLSVHEDVVAALRAEVERKTSTPPSHTFIAASHSHCSPVLSTLEGSAQRQRDHVAMVSVRLGEACEQALSELQSARLEVGRGTQGIAVNRRETNAKGEAVIGRVPEGPIDPDLLVLQVRAESGEPICTLVNLACHPTCLSPRHRIATAAWPGQMRSVVEAHTGAPVLFIQGATGDLNPDHAWGKGEIEAMVRLGTEVGEATIRVLESTRPIAGVPIRAERREVLLALNPELRPNGAPLDHLDALRRQIPVPRFAARWLLDRCYPWRSRERETPEGPAVPMEAQVLRVGELALVGWAAEVFHALALDLKAESPAAFTLFGGYSNGMIGYLPTREEHQRGGYEVDVSPYFYRLSGRLDPSSAERAAAQSRELLKQLFSPL